MRGDSSNMTVIRRGEVFIAANPRWGALSTFSSSTFVAFQIAMVSDDRDLVICFWQQLGLDQEEAERRTVALWEKLKRDGWFRTELPREEGEVLEQVYFTITRECNLACPYCYMGLDRSAGSQMSFESATKCLDDIRKINPGCKIALTGGEPFTHDQVFDFLEAFEERKFRVVILSNGTLINSDVAGRLSSLTCLDYVQISVDGVTPATHGLTRGDSFAATWAGIHALIDQGVPFCLAPTVHDDNLHEIHPLARFALMNHGTFSPNNLRCVHRERVGSLHYSEESLHFSVYDVSLRLEDEFGVEAVSKLTPSSRTGSAKAVTPLSSLICGMARSLIDIDWNGDVYPCHLLREDAFRLGNAFAEPLERVLERAGTMGIRAPADEIAKCKGCIFVCTCHGGCRAAAYRAYGSLSREDDLCDLLFQFGIESSMLQHYRRLGQTERVRALSEEFRNATIERREARDGNEG